MCIATKKDVSNMKTGSCQTHKQCANFNNGFCLIYGIAVNADAPACPNFTPNITEQTQANPIHLPALYQSAAPTLTINGNAKLFLSRGRRMHAYAMSWRGGRGRIGGAGRGGGGRGSETRGRGRGRMGGGFAAGPGGSCNCPNCGYTASHTVGTPCYQQICPKCGSRMTRITELERDF